MGSVIPGPKTLDKWLEWQSGLHPRTIDLGLERVSGVWRSVLHQPMSGIVLTVAGTNGKGSCVAMLESILLAAGYRTGCYTSPHLIRYNERIRLDGEEATDESICNAFEVVDQARGEVPLTYFEFGTLAALYLFAGHTPDVILLEVGLGGRLDAVNILDPDVALITTVDIDHTEWLGETRDAIALEKGGIMRPGRAAVYGDLDAPTALIREARARQVPLSVAGLDFSYEETGRGWNWQGGGIRHDALPKPGLPGRFQLNNASAVMMVLTLLGKRLPVARSAVDAGLRDAKTAGRFQVIASDPLIIVDVAHNPQAAHGLASNLIDSVCRGHTIAVFAMLEGKDIEGVVNIMLPRIDHWCLVSLKGDREMSGDALAARVMGAGVDKRRISQHRDTADALDSARVRSGVEDRILVFGSFHLAGDAMRVIQGT